MTEPISGRLWSMTPSVIIIEGKLYTGEIGWSGLKQKYVAEPDYMSNTRLDISSLITGIYTFKISATASLCKIETLSIL